jgi:hypothetical protein
VSFAKGDRMHLTTADVLMELADNARALPHAPLFQVVLPPLLTHLALDMNLDRAAALALVGKFWDLLAPSFPALRLELERQLSSGEPLDLKRIAAAGDEAILANLPKTGGAS